MNNIKTLKLKQTNRFQYKNTCDIGTAAVAYSQLFESGAPLSKLPVIIPPLLFNHYLYLFLLPAVVSPLKDPLHPYFEAYIKIL